MMSGLRQAIRMILKNRAFSAIAIVTLALGIGANTAIFSIMNTVLLKPFGYKDADAIMAIWESVQKNGPERWRVAPANFLDWEQETTHFAQMSSFGATTLNLTGGGEPEQLNGVHVTEGYFKVLGVDPVLGRTFLPQEHSSGQENVVILSNELWKRRFGGDTNIIGKTIRLDGNPYTVIGIMPEGIYPGWPQTSGEIEFRKSYQQFWIPTLMTSQWKMNRRSHVLGVIGRLKPDATMAQAQAEMDGIAGRLEQKYAENEDEGILISPLTEEIVGNVRPALFILLGIVGFVLLIDQCDRSSQLYNGNCAPFGSGLDRLLHSGAPRYAS